jgi:hypothetical protein
VCRRISEQKSIYAFISALGQTGFDVKQKAWHLFRMFMESVQRPKPSIFHIAHDVLLRVFAIVLIGLSIMAWLRLVGISGESGPNWRFDTMEPQWQLALLMIAVVGPVTATGLWMLSSWGVALWLGLTLFQIIIFTVLDHLFEPRPIGAAMQALSIFAYALVWIMVYRTERAREQA